MTERVLVIFPECDGLKAIEHIRRRFDPLASLIPAHITLVFPFTSELSTDALRAHVQEAVSAMQPFRVRLQGVTGQDGEYLFLNVKEGNDALIELHDRLYSGPLAAFLSREHTYVPHLTVGRVHERAAFLEALADLASFTLSFSAVVREVTCYGRLEQGQRPIEFHAQLGDSEQSL